MKKMVWVLLVISWCWTSISSAGDYHPPHPEKYIDDPFVKQKLEQMERRDQEKSAAGERAARQQREAAEESAANSRRESAYSQSQVANKKKVKKMREGQKSHNSWQLNH